ncbi:hypothetical protein ACFLTD_01835 [Elusimicrobiota bacterium]
MVKNKIEFISLFVSDLRKAIEDYSVLFATEPVECAGSIPLKHPFSPLAPVVFDMGNIKIALYQADSNTTHTGDVGLGLISDENTEEILQRAVHCGGQVLISSDEVTVKDAQNPKMSVFMMRDRHFYELVSDRDSS